MALDEGLPGMIPERRLARRQFPVMQNVWLFALLRVLVSGAATYASTRSVQSERLTAVLSGR
jgi:hypothetical protein